MTVHNKTRAARTVLATLACLASGALMTSQGQAQPGQKAGCPNINANLPITVAANASEFLKDQGQVILRGDVTIDQGVLHLAADQVTVKYSSDKKGDPGAQGQVSSLLAIGTVKVECENDRAHGGQAFYDVAKRTIALKDNVLLVREGNILKGQTLFIDLDTGHSAIEGGGAKATADDIQTDTRIKAIFTPAGQPTPENTNPQSTDENENN